MNNRGARDLREGACSASWILQRKRLVSFFHPALFLTQARADLF